MQTTSHLLMIQPVRFTYNAQTAVNNAFQQNKANEHVQENSLREFNTFVALLQQNGIDVTVVADTPEPHTPDSVFPNNWISFHTNGTIVLYPMFAANRRLERKPHVIEAISKKFVIQQIIDLTAYEQQQLFLEGTGSMVLDRENKIAYACLSPRTNEVVLKDFCNQLNYTPVVFHARDANGGDIYHTNVMMCVAKQFVIICLASIPAQEREEVISTLQKTNKEIIDITLAQMNAFAGNMLQVTNKQGKDFLVMSSSAYNALTNEQIAAIEHYNSILHSGLTTIETNGGGSARCMMAEVFLPEL
jgi:hypothetical protein